MDIVDILDSDEEQAAEKPKNETSTNNEAPSTISSTPSTESIPKNRPGPLSMKVKLGVPVEKDPIQPEEQNQSESPTPDSDQDFRKQNKILTKLVDPNSKFLADFDPEHSIRERRKMVRKTTGPQPTSYAKPGTLFDDNGVHRDTCFDVCDCLDISCPGCHFECPGCGSHKW